MVGERGRDSPWSGAWCRMGVAFANEGRLIGKDYICVQVGGMSY